MIARLLLLALLLCPFHLAPAQEKEDPVARLQRVKDEIVRRRKLREEGAIEPGKVYAPARPDASPSEPVSLVFKDEMLELCGQVLARLAQKEVMVSSRVARKTVTFSTEKMNRDEALAALRRAIEKQDVAIIEVGPDILVLLDAGRAAK